MTAPLAHDDVALIALLNLPYMSWERLRPLLRGHSATAAWRAVRNGEAGEAWQKAALAMSLSEVADRYGGDGAPSFARRGAPAYPGALAEDHEAPDALFWRGAIGVLDGPRVAIVGTRRATHYGREVARQFGFELAAAGVCVVSGLAAGIDGAAHAGALTAVIESAVPAAAGGAGRPAAVVGSGLDVVYPRRHALLWQRVGEHGVLLTEAPLGARPEAWRFPARNRIIAALAHVVVVVESRASGGSMHTVRAAEERSVTVLAVPGPVRSRASEGTNLLLSQGCHPACDTADILAALSLTTAGAAMAGHRSPRSGSPARPEPDGVDGTVLAAVDWSPTAVEQLLARTGLVPPALSAALHRLEQAGWVARDDGWWQRC